MSHRGRDDGHAALSGRRVCSASWRRTSSRMAARLSTSPGRRRAIRGTGSILPAARRAAPVRRSRRVRAGRDGVGHWRVDPRSCGIVRHRRSEATYGLVSRAGVYANSFTFDHAGPMTWTVEDCAIMLQRSPGTIRRTGKRRPGDSRLSRRVDRRYQGIADRHPASSL